MRVVGAWRPIALVVTLIALPLGAAESSPRLILTWEGPPECSRGDRVRASALELSGPNADRSPLVNARVQVSKTRSGYHVKLVTEQLDQRGEREFDGPSCDKIADAVALVLSLMLTPVETTEVVAPEGVAEVVRERKKLPRRRPAAPAPATGGLYGGPRIGGDIGTLPRPTLFVGPSLGWVFGKPRVEAYGLLFVPRQADEGPRPESGATLGLYVAGARGCYQVLGGALSLDGCLGIEGGGMYGQGRGIRDPDSSTVLFFSGNAGLFLRGEGGTLPGVIGIEALVPASRPAFTIEGYGEIYRSAPLSGRVVLGIEIGP